MVSKRQRWPKANQALTRSDRSLNSNPTGEWHSLVQILTYQDAKRADGLNSPFGVSDLDIRQT